MGMAPVAHILFNKFMTFNPKNPKYINRDRFVLSYVAPILPVFGFPTSPEALPWRYMLVGLFDRSWPLGQLPH